MNKVIKKWRDATEELAKVFVEKYFPQQVNSKYVYWVGDEIGGVLYVCDYFFNIDAMIDALELNATVDQLIDYYDMEVDYGMEDKPVPVNFKNYIKYGVLK